MAGMLVRTKMVPLHLEVDFTCWSQEHIDAFEQQLEDHISHTRHLKVRGHLQMVLKRLVSPAPTLEFLSLSHSSRPSAPNRDAIPVNLFNGTTPSLTSLELQSCDIGWKLPLLKGLKTLKICWIDPPARPKLEDWLDALDEMPQLESLFLQHATPSSTAQLMSEPSRTVTIPFLTYFHISASSKDCALALAHLVMPALTSLLVNIECHEMEPEDVVQLIPYVARNAYGPQDTEPLRSILIGLEGMQVKVVAWTMPDADLNLSISSNTSTLPRLVFTAKDSLNFWIHPEIFDGLLMHLPVDSVSTFTAGNHTGVSKEFWLKHAPRWPSLEQARLAPSAVKAFRDMLAEDSPPDSPRLPSLTKLILDDVTLTAPRTFSLLDILIERVEQGVPLDFLDLHNCIAPERAIQLLREVVVDVKEPWFTKVMVMEWPKIFNLHREIGYWDEVEFDDDEDDDENEDSDGAEYDTYDDSEYDDGY
jgi:hypothetical protein